MLLEASADVLQKSRKNGRTALHFAKDSGNRAVIQRLMDAGAVDL
jgi:ankyrin repeat protein